jgi:folate-binding protein YgfZ
MPESGQELSEQFNPYDLNLLEFVSFSKGCYIGQEVISRINTYQKIRKRLTGLLIDAPPSGGRARVMKAETEVGVVTSWTRVGTDSAFPGLAVVRANDLADGDLVHVRTDAGSFRAVAVRLPITQGEG